MHTDDVRIEPSRAESAFESVESVTRKRRLGTNCFCLFRMFTSTSSTGFRRRTSTMR